ncbi:hypothetical protein AWC15_05980 [Mycobacterium lacus]|nr:hypothetical protein AWC15_05980 [Mycobacterium lacus]
MMGRNAGKGAHIEKLEPAAKCSPGQPFRGGAHEALGVDSIPAGMHPNDLGDDVGASLSGLR